MSISRIKKPNKIRGFTIVELLIVIIVIAILATITIIAYNGIIGRSQESVVKSDLQEALTQLKLAHVETGTYPADTDNIKKSDSVTFTAYTSDTNTFCLEAINNQLPDSPFHVTDVGRVEAGGCEVTEAQDGDFIQTVTAANCPATKVRAVDARDNHTYWVQKLADGQCWMLTNLAYGGGGTNTYGDAKTLSNGTADGAAIYTAAKYYVVPNTVSYTTEPTAPSTSTDGTGQYGYLYNWCATMGVQTSTIACNNAYPPPLPNPNISICPSGWRIPTGNGGDFDKLNTAINGGLTNTDVGLRNSWLIQRSGYWGTNFGVQGTHEFYWSSNDYSAAYAYLIQATSGSFSPNITSLKSTAYAIRCLAV